jgi:8-oxo-dGTP pyrophosphatase MutT (NUDIX family)
MNERIEAAEPTSFAQRRLWVIEHLNPASATYNVSQALCLRGRLHAIALARALDQVVLRHESLRTRFGIDDGEPVQLVEESRGPVLELVALDSHPPREAEAAARRLAREELGRPFDLERDPLICAKLLRLGETEHWLLLTLHHIVTDGWSMEVLWRELSALYAAFCRGEDSPLPPLPIQYADYAVGAAGGPGAAGGGEFSGGSGRVRAAGGAGGRVEGAGAA